MMNLVGIIIEFLSIMLAGVFSGFLGSLTGLGGGTILVPMLTLFYGIPIIFATGASLISTIATSDGSASAYTKEKIANVNLSISLEMATTGGAIVGSFVAIYMYAHSLSWIVYITFGAVLLFSLYPAIKKIHSEIPKKSKPDWSTRFFRLTGSYFDEHLKRTIKYQGSRWYLGETIMFFAGFFSGLLGIGSGALKVLGMDWALNLPMKVTTTTSNFMIGITAATSSTIYWYAGFIQPMIAAATALGVLVGAYYGSKVLVKISNKDIRLIFFSILIFLGLDMIFSGLNKINIVLVNSVFQFSVAAAVAALTIILLFFHNKRGVKRRHGK
ncbi:MAG: sulfite exporter TauE/SafE family protein [Candidatus Thermoplasmatota archaeon]|jgi:uncharacterized membrane protein YfcA|nr:sulfite exporter TauE/SafE family protein [Candidatus Thermoplasmatota archaeon]